MRPESGCGLGKRMLTNVSDYNQQYWGVDFTAQKRYSDKWMARFAFTWPTGSSTTRRISPTRRASAWIG